MEISSGITLSLIEGKAVNRLDIIEGDKLDGMRLSGLKINRGRRWKRWDLPAAVLRLERRNTK